MVLNLKDQERNQKGKNYNGTIFKATDRQYEQLGNSPFKFLKTL